MADLCNTQVDFVFKEKSPEIKEIGDPIRADLRRLNITLREIAVTKEEFTKREKDGNYNIVFTKTWGAPYDPHSYLSAWATPAHVEFTSTKGLKKPMTQADVERRVSKVLLEQDPSARNTQFREILAGVHQQAAFLPLYGVKTPYVLSNRLEGFVPSPQTYSYPIASINVKSGPSSVSVAPGSGGTMFASTGRIHPHLYSPNELWAQDWVYERLVSYGKNGAIVPALAKSWTTTNDGDGWKIVFKLREGVKFHNDEPWNCAAAKLNFDHVLHPDIKERHAWFKATEVMKEWGCEGAGKNDFFIKTSERYYPLLQELSYIRPLAFAAPGAFRNGVNTDPKKANSCNPGELGIGNEGIEKNIVCGGLRAPIGTGPFSFDGSDKRDIDGKKVDAVARFKKFDGYWGTTGNISAVEVRFYEKTSQVKADLVDGKLDMALGLGPLEAAEIKDLRENHKDKVNVVSSNVTQHALAVFNTAKAPTDDVNFRKAIIYGVDKGEDIIKPEFADVRVKADQLMPRTQPHSNFELTPKFSYNLDTAQAQCLSGSSSSSLSTGGIVGIVIAVLVVLGVLLGGLVFMRRKKRNQQGAEEQREIFW